MCLLIWTGFSGERCGPWASYCLLKAVYTKQVHVFVKIAELQAINVHCSKFSLLKFLISQFLVFKPVFLFSFLAWKTSHLRSWWGRNSPSSRYFLLINLTCFFFQFVESSEANNGFSKWINSYGDNYLTRPQKIKFMVTKFTEVGSFINKQGLKKKSVSCPSSMYHP